MSEDNVDNVHVHKQYAMACPSCGRVPERGPSSFSFFHEQCDEVQSIWIGDDSGDEMTLSEWNTRIIQ